jgi:hypothetical protein
VAQVHSPQQILARAAIIKCQYSLPHPELIADQNVLINVVIPADHLVDVQLVLGVILTIQNLPDGKVSKAE